MPFKPHLLQVIVRTFVYILCNFGNKLLLAIDALIVGVETQARYLAKKQTWTRKVVLVTDGESPIEIEDWDSIIKKMDSFNVALTIMCAVLLTLFSNSDL